MAVETGRAKRIETAARMVATALTDQQSVELQPAALPKSTRGRAE